MTVENLLAFIRRHESRGDYNIVWLGIKAADKPKKPLTEMTISEVLAWQDRIDPKYRSEAAGAYQIMEDTLRSLYRSAGIPVTAKFDRETQDKLAIALLRRRGLDEYLAGKISAEQFGLNVAKEWASMPVPVRGHSKYGRSYYDGDGLNSTKVKVSDFMAPIYAIKSAPPPAATKPAVPKTTADPKPATPKPAAPKLAASLPAFLPLNPLLTLKDMIMPATPIQTEIARLARHALTPLAVYLVASGALPEAMQVEFLEVGVVIASFVTSLIWSRFARKA